MRSAGSLAALFVTALGVVASACGGGPPLPPSPQSPVQGQGTLLSPNGAVLVDPAGRSVWVQHAASLLAVGSSSGTISRVLPLTGLSDARVAFLGTGMALVLADDATACPYVTHECTRIIPVHTDTLAAEASSWEGSVFYSGSISPRRDLLLLRGGAAAQGVFVVGVDGETPPVAWADGAGWGSCVANCEERLWVVDGSVAQSWRAVGGQLDGTPDVTLDLQCGATSGNGSNGPSWFFPQGVAASEDGRWIALGCPDGTFSLVDSTTWVVRHTPFFDSLVFSAVGDLIVEGAMIELDTNHDGKVDTLEPCLRLIRPSDLGGTVTCFGTGALHYSFYVTENGADVLVSGSDGSLFLVSVPDGQTTWVGDGDSDLLASEFVERPGADQVWLARGGTLSTIDFAAGVSSPLAPFRVDHLNVIPGQDRLALLSSGTSLIFYSMGTGTAQLVVPLP